MQRLTLRRVRTFANLGKNVRINPLDHRDAHSIPKAGERLIYATPNIELGRSLKAGVFSRRHPAHFHFSVPNQNDDLAGASAVRRPQAASDPIEARLDSCRSLTDASESRTYPC